MRPADASCAATCVACQQQQQAVFDHSMQSVAHAMAICQNLDRKLQTIARPLRCCTVCGCARTTGNLYARGDEWQGGMASPPHLLAAIGQEGVAVHDRQHDVLPLHARLARAGLHDVD